MKIRLAKFEFRMDLFNFISEIAIFSNITQRYVLLLFFFIFICFIILNEIILYVLDYFVQEVFGNRC